MNVSRRSLVAGGGVLLARALLPSPAVAGRRGLWDEPGELGRLAVFRQEVGGGPGVSPATLRALVTNGPPATVGLMAAYGLRVMGVRDRKPAAFARATAVLLMPARLLVVEGQFLVPTIDEALRALLGVETGPVEEAPTDLWERLHGLAAVDNATVLASAHGLAIQAVKAHDEPVLRRLGLAQLAAWHIAPPAGYADPPLTPP